MLQSAPCEARRPKEAPELPLGDELQAMRFAATAARLIARQKTHQVFRCHLNVVSGQAMGIPCTSSFELWVGPRVTVGVSGSSCGW